MKVVYKIRYLILTHKNKKPVWTSRSICFLCFDLVVLSLSRCEKSYAFFSLSYFFFLLFDEDFFWFEKRNNDDHPSNGYEWIVVFVWLWKQWQLTNVIVFISLTVARVLFLLFIFRHLIFVVVDFSLYIFVALYLFTSSDYSVTHNIYFF